METKSIRQTCMFNASPAEVYQLIMDEHKHAAFTGSQVIMSTEINGEFSIFGGYCHGHNMELEEGKRIVQAWHFEEEGWPDGHFSTCTFLFEPVKNQTRLTFLQENVPAENAEALEEGWQEYYWEPMSEFLQNHQSA